MLAGDLGGWELFSLTSAVRSHDRGKQDSPVPKLAGMVCGRRTVEV